MLKPKPPKPEKSKEPEERVLDTTTRKPVIVFPTKPAISTNFSRHQIIRQQSK